MAMYIFQKKSFYMSFTSNVEFRFHVVKYTYGFMCEKYSSFYL